MILNTLLIIILITHLFTFVLNCTLEYKKINEISQNNCR